jgi:hypothetical protein
LEEANKIHQPAGGRIIIAHVDGARLLVKDECQKKPGVAVRNYLNKKDLMSWQETWI